MPQDDHALLWVRFIGPELGNEAIPIDELGRALQAIQQIVYKSARLDYGASVDGGNRSLFTHMLLSTRGANLALQLRYHERGSDIYGFVAFAIDPAVQKLLEGVMDIVLQGLAPYVKKAVAHLLSGDRKQPPQVLNLGSVPAEQNRMLVQSILPDAAKIVGIIGGSSPVTEIQFSRTRNFEHVEIKFDWSHREFLESVRQEPEVGVGRRSPAPLPNLTPKKERSRSDLLRVAEGRAGELGKRRGGGGAR